MASDGKKRLVIVESATKARKIGPYLGDDYIVKASVGHIRDLPRNAADIPATYKKEPWARLGVNVDDDFEALYVTNPDKRKLVADLKKDLKNVDELLLATDPDREGEAIAWHLLEVLKPKVPYRRMVFHEITKPAILEAAENTRDLDYDLVHAQETRRILDRLYGYEISPVLWKKVMPRLSAGRVQSVVTRMIVERERDRMRFSSAEYWDLTATLALSDAELSLQQSGTPRTFNAKLVTLAGRKVAQGADFDDQGQLTTQAIALNSSEASALAEELSGSEMAVTEVKNTPYTRKPYAPFITSTLQQEAGRKLHYTSDRTMRVAQRLYEKGHITYMRTDSTALSDSGMNAARQAVKQMYGTEYLSSAPRQYSKSVKNAQEAHEAIRPAGDSFATPGGLAQSLDAEEYKLYELIWQRTVASQMANAQGNTLRVTITALDRQDKECDFAATGRTITFPGFLKAYVETSQLKDGSDVADNAEKQLPELSEGDLLTANAVEPVEHHTQPPARFTEASLVKTMGELGIGRPSTYASIIRTIQDRGYVYSRGNALVPSWTAFAVVGLLEDNFNSLVNYEFTSSMEDDLDEIANGTEDRTEWLSAFYFGDEDATDDIADVVAKEGGLKELVSKNLEGIDARKVNSLYLFDDADGVPIVVRVGRYGAYLERIKPGKDGGEPEIQRANLPESATPDELTLEVAEKLFATPQGGRELGTNPANGRTIVAKEGRFGPYVTEQLSENEQANARVEAEKTVGSQWDAIDEERVAEGKKAVNRETKTTTARWEKEVNQAVEDMLKPATASLFSDMEPATVTLDQALDLLSLPREVGVDPSDNEVITAQNGRYGPYLKKGDDARSLSDEHQIFTITLPEALAIYALPKQRGRAAAKPPLKILGNNDVSDKTMVVKDGRFGPYVTDGETNASLRRGDVPESLTDERANELLSERRTKDEVEGKISGGAVKKTAKKASKKASKTPAKKAKKKAKVTKKPPTLTKRTVAAKRK